MLKLREGKEYKFLVVKEIIMAQDSRCFVLLGPDRKKYLIPFDRYSHYNINIGDSIRCRVDKINCNGEVFIEPKNPYYIEGELYPFEVAGYDTRTGTSGIRHDVVIVLDRFRNLIPVPYEKKNHYPPVGAKLDLVVGRITKGKIYLFKRSEAVPDEYLRYGQIYEFLIERVEKGMDDEEYFIIKDPFGRIHTIRKEYYEYYGYKTGTRFKGKIIKYKEGGEMTVEPENPFYKKGSVISLRVLSFTRNAINNSFTVNLKDDYGFTYCIEAAIPPEDESVRCRISRIKKGKPLLELL